MAAQHGAVAALVRAVGPMGLRTPHTGGMNYGDERGEDSDRRDPRRRRQSASSASSDRGLRVRVRLMMEAHFEPDVESFNVVGEIRGSELPGRDRAGRRPFRFVGRRHGRVGRWRRLHRDVGGGCA